MTPFKDLVMCGNKRCSMGPHPLDTAWGITDTWVGIGFGLERLLMVSKKGMSIGKWAKNLAYVDGICLSI